MRLTNVEALQELIAALDGLPTATAVALAETLAAEIDRQAKSHQGVNAALVERYVTCLQGLVPQDGQEEDGEKADVLSIVRQSTNTGAG